jgi:hypothetical protein
MLSAICESASGPFDAANGLKHADALVAPEHGLDVGQVALLGQVGHHHLHPGAMRRGQLARQRVQAIGAARHQEQVVAAGGQAFGVDGADAGGGAGDDGGARGGGRVGHGVFLV